MKKLISLKDCSEDEPIDPGAGGTPEEINEYNNERSAWFRQCLAELTPKVPSEPPTLTDTPYVDNKGFIWTKEVSFNRVEIKLDLLATGKNFVTQGNPDAAIIVGLQITFGSYYILTMGKEGIRKHSVAHYKIRVAKLLSAMCDHTNVAAEPWMNPKKEHFIS